jgi:hypothetical protein
MDLPKPQYAYVGRLYAAVVASGANPASANRESVDTLIRILARSTWVADNADIINIWNRGGDVYGDMIKDLRAYASTVTKSRKAAKAVRAQPVAPTQLPVVDPDTPK